MKLRLLLSLLLLGPAELYADAALLLQQPHSAYGSFIPAGHMAVYLSRVCAESPTELRRCREGEPGAVLSRYSGIADYDWLAIPLIPYFYAVEEPEAAPAAADRAEVARLREEYRMRHLREVVTDEVARREPEGRWTQLVGTAYERKTYVFQLETDAEADDRLIEHFNSSPNRRRFNLLWRNCADFAKDIFNFYYPRTLRRSILADAGITTPKQLAKGLVQFSRRRPELAFSAFAIPQVEGDLNRSKPVRGVLEALVRSKKYVVPLAVVLPWVAVGGSVAYVTGGRFNPEKLAADPLDPGELARSLVAGPPSSAGSVDLLDLGLPPAEQEGGHDDEGGPRDDQDARGGPGRFEGIDVKVEEDGGDLHRQLLHRDDVAGLGEFEGLVGLPDAQDVAAHEDDARQREQPRLAPGPVPGEDDGADRQERADPEVRDREGEPVRKGHDDPLAPRQAQRLQVAGGPEREEAHGEDGDACGRAGVAEALPDDVDADFELAQAEQDDAGHQQGDPGHLG